MFLRLKHPFSCIWTLGETLKSEFLHELVFFKNHIPQSKMSNCNTQCNADPQRITGCHQKDNESLKANSLLPKLLNHFKGQPECSIFLTKQYYYFQ